MEEFRLLIRQIISGTGDLEEALVKRHDDIFEKLMDYHYANDVRTLLEERGDNTDDPTVKEIVRELKDNYDSNCSVWENVGMAIDAIIGRRYYE